MNKLLTRARIAKLGRIAEWLIHKDAPKCKRGHKMRMSGRTGFLHVDRSPAAIQRRQKRFEKKYKKILGGKKIPPPVPPTVSFYCPICHKNPRLKYTREERPISSEEMELLAEIDVAEDARGKAMHKLIHTFQRMFLNRESDNDWKWQGWELMKRIERAEKGPLKGIQLLRCDDNYHASSMLAVIPHEVRIDGRLDEYWGTTIVYVSQCSGEPPVRLFLYDSHARPLHTLLGRIVRAHEKHGDRY
jgi:hypothetical protein